MNILKKRIVYIVGFLFLITIFFVFLFLKTRPPETQLPTVVPSGPPLPAQGEGYQKSLEEIRASEEESIRRDEIVGKLLDKLPYQGTNFSLSYDFSTNRFVAHINKNAIADGNDEFDAFLKTNGIEERSWIKNLVVRAE